MKPRFLLDTNIVSMAVRRDAPLQLLQQLAAHRHTCAIAAPIWHELVFGLSRLDPSRRRDQLEHYIYQVVRPNYPVLSYDEAAAEWHARRRDAQIRSGTPSPWTDTLIAAIAVVNRVTLVTNNTKDFSTFAELSLEDWSIAGPQ